LRCFQATVHDHHGKRGGVAGAIPWRTWSFYKGDIYAKFLDYPDQRHDDDLHIDQQWMLEKEVSV
jgi:hypothetical protein